MVTQKVLDEAFATFTRNGGSMSADDFMRNWAAVDPQRSIVRDVYANLPLRDKITTLLQERGGEYPTYALANGINLIVASTFGRNTFPDGLNKADHPNAGWVEVDAVRGELQKMEKDGLVKRNGMSSNSIVWKLKK